MLRPAWYRPIAGPTAVLAALALAACSSGGSGEDSSRPQIDKRWVEVCEQPLPPGQGGAVTTERFQTADDGLAEMERLARAGDLKGARDVFFSQTHGLTHDIDGALRSANPPVARELCGVIAQIEADFASARDGEVMAALAVRARELMRQSSTLLGYPE